MAGCRERKLALRKDYLQMMINIMSKEKLLNIAIIGAGEGV